MKTFLLVLNQIIRTGLVVVLLMVFADVARSIRTVNGAPLRRLREVFLGLTAYVAWFWVATFAGPTAYSVATEYIFIPTGMLFLVVYRFWRSLHDGSDYKTTTGPRRRS